jgi:large subunit ribosomal protein L3
MKFILGKKIGMMQVFREDGTVVPVTRVQAGPCIVTQIKTKEKDGASAVQVGFGEQKKFRLNKAKQGHLKDLTTVRIMRDFRIEEGHDLKRGDQFTVGIFQPGEKVQVTGSSKGKGFQGVVKRHGFHGQPSTHGHKDQSRHSGSIGAGGVARVWKGKRMGGHMGDERVTVKNLEIVEIRPTENELLIKGAVPGARHGLLLIFTGGGKMEMIKMEAAAPVQNDNKEIITEMPKESEQGKPAEIAVEEQVSEAKNEKIAELEKVDIAK